MEELEKLRKKALLILLLSITIIIIGVILTLGFLSAIFTIILAVGIILLIVYSCMLRVFKAKIVLLFKNEFEKKYPGYTYDKKSGVNINAVYQGGLINKRADRYNVEDLITAKFNNGMVYSSDLKMDEIIEYRDSDGKRRREIRTYFLGKYYIFDFNNHNFNINLKAFEKGLRYVNVHGLTECETESIAFNEKYKTYVSDTLELFRYLKPQVIEKITELEKKYKGAVGLSMFSNQIHLAIYNNIDSLEFSVIKKVNEKVINERLVKTHDEIENLLELLDANDEKYSK